MTPPKRTGRPAEPGSAGPNTDEKPAPGQASVAATGARLRRLERENARLRRIVADRDLEIEMLREISRGTY
jgi:hypothetical protein